VKLREQSAAILAKELSLEMETIGHCLKMENAAMLVGLVNLGSHAFLGACSQTSTNQQGDRARSRAEIRSRHLLVHDQGWISVSWRHRKASTCQAPSPLRKLVKHQGRPATHALGVRLHSTSRLAPTQWEADRFC